MELERLESQLGYTFGDRSILLRALTHCSFGHEKLQDLPLPLRDNERLEFLGDAVIDLIVSDLLLEQYPGSNEGQLSKMRAALVKESTLAQLAQVIHLGKHLRLGKGEEQSGGRTKPSILSSCFEALIAAIYLDGGVHAAFPVVRFLFLPLLQEERDALIFTDHKSQLQEIVQARWKVTPTYNVFRSLGPDHAKTFEVEVKMRNEVLARAIGPSKKQAEQRAARAAIEQVTR